MSRPTVTDILEAYIRAGEASGKSHNTIKERRLVLGRFARSVPPYPAPRDAEDHIAAAPSASQADRRLKCLRAMYRWAGRHLSVKDITKHIEKTRSRRRLPYVLSESEVQAVIRVARRDRITYAAIAILLGTGIRRGELASLTTASIRLGRNRAGEMVRELHVPAVEGNKTGARRVGLPHDAYAVVLPILAPDPSAPIFRWGGRRSGAMRAISASSLGLRVGRCLRDAGIVAPRVGPHTLRHTYATAYIRQGGDIWRLQAVLGHSSIAHTMLYLQLANDDVLHDIDQLSAFKVSSRPTPLAIEHRRENPAS